jgi:hypothetical protein
MPSSASSAPAISPSWAKESSVKMVRELAAKYGDSQRERIERGLRQVSEFWHSEDGDANAFENFVRIQFRRRSGYARHDVQPP